MPPICPKCKKEIFGGERIVQKNDDVYHYVCIASPLVLWFKKHIVRRYARIRNWIKYGRQTS